MRWRGVLPRLVAFALLVLFGGSAVASGTLTTSGKVGANGQVLQVTYTRDLLAFGPISTYAAVTARGTREPQQAPRIDLLAGVGLVYTTQSGLWFDLRLDYRQVYASDPRAYQGGPEVSFALVVPLGR